MLDFLLCEAVFIFLPLVGLFCVGEYVEKKKPGLIEKVGRFFGIDIAGMDEE
ncbi:MAG: hypothetical protein IJE10_04910 [Clostridia bacterium]|nr:hypothetical protein [Clostridia bacterium]